MQHTICRLKLLFLILICFLFQEIDLNAAESMPKTVLSPVTDACKAVAGWMYCVAHYLANRQLIKAATSGNLGKVKSAILCGADVNCIDIFSDEYVHKRTVLKDTIGNTALLIASSRGHIEIVKFLLTVPGIDVNSANEKLVYSDEGHNWLRKKHQTPLRCVLARNLPEWNSCHNTYDEVSSLKSVRTLELAQLLLGDLRIRIDLLSALEQTDLMMAICVRCTAFDRVWHQKPYMVKLFLEHSKLTPDIFGHIDSNGNNILIAAVHLDICPSSVVRLILNHKYMTSDIFFRKNHKGNNALSLVYHSPLYWDDFHKDISSLLVNKRKMQDDTHSLLLAYENKYPDLACIFYNYKDGLFDDIFTKSEIDLFNK